MGDLDGSYGEPRVQKLVILVKITHTCDCVYIHGLGKYFPDLKRVYGQFCIETLHESRKGKSSGLFVQISTFTLGFFLKYIGVFCVK